MTRYAPLALVAPLLFAMASSLAAEPLEVRVDPRVELVSIVFRLAGHPEYNMPNSRSPYADAVEERFGRFRDHEAVRMARELRARRGISYDAVMSLAVHLDDDVAAPKPRTPLDPRPESLEGRWTGKDASAFIGALAAFSRDADFPAFVAENRQKYAACAARLSAVANRREFVAFFDDFFGQRPRATFAVIVGMLEGGGNYGVSMRHADGREEITPVIGVYKWDLAGLPAIGDDSMPTIVHEFCHAYTNAIVDRHIDALEPVGRVFFERNREVMRQQAYATPRTVLYETFVRACVTHYMSTEAGGKAGAAHATYEMGRGFKWTPELAALLGEYASSRAEYKTFDDFMPRVIEHLVAVANDYDALLAKFPKLVTIDPPDGAADLDAGATTTLVITFDRPMRDKSWSIVGAGPTMPVLGPPSYDAERKVFTVPVTLEPGKEYRFGLNGVGDHGFASPDGRPLEPTTVRWKTRP